MRALKAVFYLFACCLIASTLLGCGEKRHVFTVDDLFMEQDVLFAKAEGAELRMDIIWPKGQGPFPALVYLFGNGWGYWSGGRTLCTTGILAAAHRNYVAAAVDYRLTGEKVEGKARYRFPSQVYDVKAAVRWLRAHASRYHIDRSRIGAIGFSSGAHLALMLGLTVPSDGLEGNLGNGKFPSNVQAVVSSGAPTDFTQSFSNPGSRGAISDFLGGPFESDRGTYAKASPISYVRAGAPPILIIHGEEDDEIPLSQAIRLDAKLKSVGAADLLIVKQRLGHLDFTEEPEAFAFLDKYLAK